MACGYEENMAPDLPTRANGAAEAARPALPESSRAGASQDKLPENDASLLQDEERFLSDARRRLSETDDPAAIRLLTEEVFGQHARLLRMFSRLVRLGDRMQARLAMLYTRISQSEACFRGIFENSAEGLFLADASGNFLEINTALASMLGHATAESFLRVRPNLSTLLEGYDGEGLLRDLEAEEARRRECVLRRADGEDIWVFLSLKRLPAPLGKDRGEGMVGLILEVTDRKRMELELTRLARTDPLTGLANRRWFMDQLHREFEVVKREEGMLSLLMIDADCFKKINDTHGHQIGDEALRAVAQVLRENLRQHDVAARYGGEEFAVLLPGAGSETGWAVAQRIRQALGRRDLDTTVGPLRLTVSIGLTTLGHQARDMDELIRQADKALYAAKQAGRNRVETYMPRDCGCPQSAVEQ